MKPQDVLTKLDLKNYLNVRAVGLFAILIGFILMTAGIAFVADCIRKEIAGEDSALLVATIMSIVGICGFVGGIAVRIDSRRYSPLIKAFAFLYLFPFPVGTILSVVLLNGLERYLDSVDQIRSAGLTVAEPTADFLEE